MNLTEAIIYLLVGLAVFIAGMNMMSSGIKKATGAGLKNIFKKIQNKSIVNFSIGVGFTGIVQSSTATDVIVMGFINAGVMSLVQGVALMMGANVGTTVTGILVSFSGFELSKYLLLLAFVGIVMQFIKNERVQAIGTAITGFGILFFGLSTMSSSIKSCQDLMNAFQNMFTAISFPLLLILVGILFSALVQSYSATIGVVVVLIDSCAITFSTGIFLLIGATIGSWLPIFLSSLNGNRESKQASFITLLVKVVAAVIGTAIIWPVEATTGAFSALCSTAFTNSGLALAIFALIYNLVLMLLQLPLIKFFVKISDKFIPNKDDEKKKETIKYLDKRMLNAPSIALMQVKKEIIHMLNLAEDNFYDGFNEIKTLDFAKKDKIEQVEDQIDLINNEVTDFLILLTNKVNSQESKKIGAYFHIINDIERIGDHAMNFQESALKMKDDNLKFSETAQAEFNDMFEIIKEMFKISYEVFENKNFDPTHLHELENKTDVLKLELESNHFNRILKKTCTVELSPFYSTFLSELERIADHLVNIGYAFINPTGDEEVQNIE